MTSTNNKPTLSSTTATTNDTVDNNYKGECGGGGSSSDSEESALIVWEDETSNLLDLRHLLNNNNTNNDNGGVNGINNSREDNNGKAGSRIDCGGDERRNNGGGEREGSGQHNNNNKRLATMTQQIDELSSIGSMDSDDDDAHNDNMKCSADEIMNVKVKGTNSNETMTPPPTAKASSTTQNNVEAAGNNNKLLNSGEIPATISKLRRRRRRGGNKKNDSSGSSAAKKQNNTAEGGSKSNSLPTIMHEQSTASSSNNVINKATKQTKKQKLSSEDDEIDRTFAFLGDNNKQQQQQQQSNSMKNNTQLSLSQSQAAIETMYHQSSNNNNEQQEGMNASTTTSPLNQRMLFLQQHGHAQEQHEQQQHQGLQPHQGQRKIKLPSLGKNRKKFDDHFEKENTGNKTSSSSGDAVMKEQAEVGKDGSKKEDGGGGGIIEDDDCDLFREIELGLDKVCAASANADEAAASVNVRENRNSSMGTLEHERAVSNEISLGTTIGSCTNKQQPMALPPSHSALGGGDVSKTRDANSFNGSRKIGSSASFLVNNVIYNAVDSVVVATASSEKAKTSFSTNTNPANMTISDYDKHFQPSNNLMAHQPQKLEQRSVNINEANEFDDDDEEWDLAAIDMSVAMTQCHNYGKSSTSFDPSPPIDQCQQHQLQQPANTMRHSAALPQPPSSYTLQRSASLPPVDAAYATIQRSASLPAGTASSSQANNNNHTNLYDEFDNDDDWNDADLAAIDMSVAMTQSHSIVNNNNFTTTNNNANKQNSEFSDDDDDDFAEVDFTALDDKIVQHQAKNQLSQVVVSPPLPPPMTAPIWNRRLAACNEGCGGPSFLSFTRYIITSVQEDVPTYTKTIGVSLWSSSNTEKTKDDELNRLKKICTSHEQSNKPNATNTNSSIAAVDGYMHLRGEYYHSDFDCGDVFHLCSLSGSYVTDTSALPIILHSHPPANSDPNDDLVFVLHPDELVSPTLVSEAVKCPRLAVLQSRLGSTGLSSKPAVIGTLRHELFERCLRSRDATHKSGALFTRQIIRNNAEALMGCGITNQREAFTEVVKTLPQIQRFLQTYTTWNATKPRLDQQQNVQGSYTPTAVLNGMFPSCDTFLEIKGVYSTEEWAYCPELGLKGNVDATVLARTKPLNPSNTQGDTMQDVLLPLELKTGHVQNPAHNHLAQLSTYTFMLRARHGSAPSCGVDLVTHNDDSIMGTSNDLAKAGAASSGMLLYLNHENQCARHVKPSLSDIKTLIGQRNGVVCDALRASRPRGIALNYEGEDSNNSSGRIIANDTPPPTALPRLQHNISTCERCYKNRECMMYESSNMNGSSSITPGKNKHGKLLNHFTGHLQGADLNYFRKWDRLIDLERHASAKDVISKSWLFESSEKERKDGKCISSLIFDNASLLSLDIIRATNSDTSEDADSDTSIRFVRSKDSPINTPLTSLSFDVGNHVIISEDGTSFTPKANNGYHNNQHRVVKHKKMYIMKGTVLRIGEHDINIVVPKKDVGKLQHSNPSNNRFRIDKDEHGGSVGLLLQNLVNFFTLDIPSFSAESMGTPATKTKTLTTNTEYSVRRRRLCNSIIRLEPPPRFLDVSEESLFTRDAFALDLHIPGCDLSSLRRDFVNLNSDQKGAVLKAISAEDFALIQGLPGTGKSATIAFITRLFISRGKRVLLTSYTHSAVDNLLCKLMDSGVMVQSSPSSQENTIASSPIIRIGRESACHLKVQTLLAQNVARESERKDSKDASSIENPSVEYLHKVVSSARVVGVSALTAPRSPLLAGQHFDVVIVDEAGQISQPAVLGAIMSADSFVLVGDHMQLPPLVVSEVAEEAGE